MNSDFKPLTDFSNIMVCNIMHVLGNGTVLHDKQMDATEIY